MSKKSAIAILAAAMAWCPGVKAQMHPGPQVAAPASIEVPRDGVIVPMQDMEGRPVVDLKINGKGPYRFVLDTGASTTIVNEELSRELSLPAPAGMHVAVAGGGTPPAMVVIHDVRIGDAVLEGVIAAAMPLSVLLKGENAPLGVLSAASFPGYLLTYDFPGKRISIKKGALGSADAKRIFQYTEGQVLPTVPVRIAGHDTQVHLDTGSPFGLTLPVKFLTELPLASQPKEARKVRTPGGEFPVSIARVKGTIELGQYKLDPDDIRFSDVRPGPGPATGNIGSDVLRHFVVTLDSKNRRIQLDQ
jgi:Aspartyl protease